MNEIMNFPTTKESNNKLSEIKNTTTQTGSKVNKILHFENKQDRVKNVMGDNNSKINESLWINDPEQQKIENSLASIFWLKQKQIKKLNNDYAMAA